MHGGIIKNIREIRALRFLGVILVDLVDVRCVVHLLNPPCFRFRMK